MATQHGPHVEQSGGGGHIKALRKPRGWLAIEEYQLLSVPRIFITPSVQHSQQQRGCIRDIRTIVDCETSHDHSRTGQLLKTMQRGQVSSADRGWLPLQRTPQAVICGCQESDARQVEPSRQPPGYGGLTRTWRGGGATRTWGAHGPCFYCGEAGVVGEAGVAVALLEPRCAAFNAASRPTARTACTVFCHFLRVM